MSEQVFEPVTIGIVLFPDAEELDWAGPYEVFGMAAKTVGNAHVVTIAERKEAVRGFNGLRVLPDHDFGDAPPLDVVLVPGGQGTRKEVDNPAMTEWLAKIAPRCRWVTRSSRRSAGWSRSPRRRSTGRCCC